MEEENGRHRFNLIFSVILLLAVIIGITVYRQQTGEVDLMMQLNDEMIGLACIDVNFFLPYRDIENVEMVDTFTPGTFTEGGETEKVWYGTYQNDEFGTYQLFAYKDTGEFIVVTAKDQNLVFNCSKLNKTTETYEQLLSALEGK